MWIYIYTLYIMYIYNACQCPDLREWQKLEATRHEHRRCAGLQLGSDNPFCWPGRYWAYLCTHTFVVIFTCIAARMVMITSDIFYVRYVSMDLFWSQSAMNIWIHIVDCIIYILVQSIAILKCLCFQTFCEPLSTLKIPMPPISAGHMDLMYLVDFPLQSQP